MTLDEIAEAIGAEVLSHGLAVGHRIERVYAGDRMSDLLTHASGTTLVVTNLATPPLLRTAALMDWPAICLVGGVCPEPAMVRAAAEHGTALVVSPLGMFETCGRLYECLRHGLRTA